MFGTYYINSEKDRVPRLTIQFENDFLNLYACGIKLIEDPLDDIYDWTADVLTTQWNPKAAKKKLKANPDMMATDALLDQTIFSGVGNIIKNEILHIIKVHPESKLRALPPRKLNELITQAAAYSHQFLQWKREGVLRKNWAVHTKKTCPRDGTKICKEHLGKTDRRTFYCPTCQVRYE
jgi:endonuclease-8